MKAALYPVAAKTRHAEQLSKSVSISPHKKTPINKQACVQTST
jgi:hypothetical protein